MKMNINIDMKKNRWRILAGIIVTCLLAIYPCFRLIHHKESYKLPKDAYQIINEQSIERPKDTVLVMDDEKGIMMKKPHETIPSTPLYYKGENRLILPVSYAMVYPDQQGKMYRVNYFTQLYNKNYKIYATIGRDHMILNDGFLFDGKDTYLFLEKTEITYGKTKLTLSPLSFVTAVYGQQGAAFNYSTGASTLIPAGAGAVVAHIGNTCTINLDTDVLQHDDSQQLLYGKPEDLKTLK